MRVMVVDDDPMVRMLISTILGATDDIEVVAEATDGDEVVPGVQAHHPDVVLMDLQMARMGGIEATRAVRALPNPPPVLAMTSFGTESAILESIGAGAAGFMAKDSDQHEIEAAVRAVAAGDGMLSPRAARTVMMQITDDPTAPARRHAGAQVQTLTDREREVAMAVAEGLSNSEIAARMYVSDATVKTHIGKAMSKVGVVNRVQLALVIDRAGFGPTTA